MTTVRFFLPEILLFATAIALVFTDVLRGRGPSNAPFFVGIGGQILALAALVPLFGEGSTEIFSRTLVIDSVSLYFKGLFIVGSIVACVAALSSRELRDTTRSDLLVLFVLATLSSCVAASSVHLLTLYVAFEASSLLFYMLAAFSGSSRASSTAGLKSLLLGSVTGLFLAFGIVLLYGYSSSLNILDIHPKLAGGPLPAEYFWVIYGLLFMAAAGRMSLFPFHLMGPGVLSGAPTPVAAYLSVIPPLAGMALALRICFHVFGLRDDGTSTWSALPGLDWSLLFAITVGVTMTVANLLALSQKDLKRLFAYSTMSQVCYFLLGFVVLNMTGLGASLFGALVYLLATMGAFLVAMSCMDETGHHDSSALRGLVWRRPVEAVALSVFILSLAGLPPLAGFTSRLYLLSTIMKEGFYWLAVVTAINTVIGFTYYFGLLRLIFERPEGVGTVTFVSTAGATPLLQGRSIQVTAVMLLLPTFALGFAWDPLLIYISNSLKNILW